MGIPSELRDMMSQRKGFLIASPADEQKAMRSKECVNEGVQQGFKTASVALVVTTVSTLLAVRKVPWFKANLNHTGQALVISGASIASYFISVDQTILECARKNSVLQDALRRQR